MEVLGGQPMKIGIVGTGQVGMALARGFSRIEEEVRMGSRDPARAYAPPGIKVVSQREAVEWADVAVLAVKYVVVREVIQSIGPEFFKGKIVLDVTNALTKDRGWALGYSTSASEEIAKLLPGTRVVKAFNTVYSMWHDKGRICDEQLSLFVAGDDIDAKQTVMKLGAQIGFEPVDCGPHVAARYLEAMAYQLIYLDDRLHMGRAIGFRLVKG
jgi:predicted dinucleotide-binding enzyme